MSGTELETGIANYTLLFNALPSIGAQAERVDITKRCQSPKFVPSEARAQTASEPATLPPVYCSCPNCAALTAKVASPCACVTPFNVKCPLVAPPPTSWNWYCAIASPSGSMAPKSEEASTEWLTTT